MNGGIDDSTSRSIGAADCGPQRAATSLGVRRMPADEQPTSVSLLRVYSFVL
jgi:hypothetical protein